MAPEPHHVQQSIVSLCDRLLIVGVQAVVIAVPLVFFYGTNAFVLPKTAVFRSIVEVMIWAWAVRRFVAGRRAAIQWDLLSALAVAFGGVVAITMLTSIDPWESFWGSYARMEGFYTLLHFGAFYMIVRDLVRSHPWVAHRLVDESVATAAIIGFIGIIEHFQMPFGNPLIPTSNLRRPDATIGNSLGLGGYLAMVLPLTIERIARLFDIRGVRRGALDVLKFLKGRWYIFALFVQGWALVLTFSRSSLVAAFGGILAGLLFWLMATNRRKAALALISVVVLMSGIVVAAARTPGLGGRVPYGAQRFLQAVAFQDDSGQIRLLGWGIMVDGMKERPWRGYGGEMISYVFHQFYNPQFMEWTRARLNRSHNIVLDIAVMHGVGALALVLLFFVAVPVQAFQGVRRQMSRGDPSAALLLAAMVSSIAAYGIQGLFYFNTPTIGMLLALCAATISACSLRHPLRQQTLARSSATDWSLNARLFVALLSTLVIGAIAITNILPWIIDRRWEHETTYNGRKRIADQWLWATPYRDVYLDELGTAITRYLQPLRTAPTLAEAVPLAASGEEIFDRALALKPWRDDYADHRTALFAVRSSLFPQRADWAADAELAYKDLSRRTPRRPQVYTSWAKFKANKKEYAAAAVLIEQALALHPGLAGTYQDYALIMALQGKNDTAMTLLKKARALRPDDLEIVYAIVSLSLRQGGNGRALAIELLERAWPSHPSAPTAAQQRRILEHLRSAPDDRLVQSNARNPLHTIPLLD